MDDLIPQALAFLAAAILAPPLFQRLGLGTAVGYLVAGVVIGPSLLEVFQDADAVMTVSQLGVVLLLFVIGLDTRISRLLAMRGDILGLGLGQVAATTVVLGAIGWMLGLSPAAAGLVGFAFALSGTAIALQILESRGQLSCPYGQKTFATLLTQDVLTVPVLALAPILLGAAAMQASATGTAWGDAALALGVVVAIVLAGRYAVDHLFRLVASAGAREVMTAAALLVVLAAAMAARAAGLSMALGAFLAGVMLAGSSYRHQIQADVEPFRGLLLALFFMSVGMLIDLADVWERIGLVTGLLVLYLAAKLTVTALVAWVSACSLREGVRIALVLCAAGEFAFVLAPLAGDLGLVSQTDVGLLVALAALSMVACPSLAALGERLLVRKRPAEGIEENFDGAGGSAIVIGFGRFGQIASQMLLADGAEITLIDRAPDRVRAAAKFGFKVYFGDGNRLDVMRAAGVEDARLVLVCIRDPNETLAVCTRLREAYPLLPIYARAYDRTTVIALERAGVEFTMRDTFESAVRAGREVLELLGVDPERAATVESDVRRRDVARLEAQKLEGIEGGMDLLHQTTMRPEPLRAPARKARALSRETEAVIEDAEETRPAAE